MRRLARWRGRIATAVGRSAKRVKEMMAERVVRLESATYENVETEHTVEALTKVFKGARVVCNTVGPFVQYGAVAVEAALKACCHCIDTTGEQSYILEVRERFGEAYRQAGLLLAPSTAYMYTFAEIAAELALETQGIDCLETASLRLGEDGSILGYQGIIRDITSASGPRKRCSGASTSTRRWRSITHC